MTRQLARPTGQLERAKLGVPYQALINLYLRECVVERKRPSLARVANGQDLIERAVGGQGAQGSDSATRWVVHQVQNLMHYHRCTRGDARVTGNPSRSSCR